MEAFTYFNGQTVLFHFCEINIQVTTILFIRRNMHSLFVITLIVTTYVVVALVCLLSHTSGVIDMVLLVSEND